MIPRSPGIPEAARPSRKRTCTCGSLTMHALQRVHRMRNERARSFQRVTQRRAAERSPTLKHPLALNVGLAYLNLVDVSGGDREDVAIQHDEAALVSG